MPDARRGIRRLEHRCGGAPGSDCPAYRVLHHIPPRLRKTLGNRRLQPVSPHRGPPSRRGLRTDPFPSTLMIPSAESPALTQHPRTYGLRHSAHVVLGETRLCLTDQPNPTACLGGRRCVRRILGSPRRSTRRLDRYDKWRSPSEDIPRLLASALLVWFGGLTPQVHLEFLCGGTVRLVTIEYIL